MELEAILRRYVGDFGRYQLFVLVLLFTMRLPTAFDTIGYVFYAATPDHWCHFPRRHDVSAVTEGQWKRFAIPLKDKTKVEYEKCSMYSWAYQPNLTADDINRTLTGATSASNDTVPCSSMEYDAESHIHNSLATKWNMVCSRAWMKPNIATAWVVGFVVGTQLTGYLSDRIGRRPTNIGAAVAVSLLFLCLPFCSHYIAFVIVRGLLSACWSGLSVTLYPLVLELVGTPYRTAVSNAFMVTWAVSYMAVAGMAYALRTWFHLMLVLACSTIVLILPPSVFLPESLLWQTAKGHEDEALATLRRIARWNRRSLPSDIKIHLDQDKLQQRTNILDLLRTPNIRRISIILCLNWFINGLVYYNISWNADMLHGNLYLNVFISGLLEVPAYLLNIPVLQYVGRRWGTGVCTLIVGVLYLISMFVPGIGGTVLILVAKFFISMTFTMIYQYTAELYPTVARATAMGLVNWFCRAGVVISSYMPLLGPFHSAIISGVICFVGASSIILLPETMYATLPANVQEVEQNGKLSFRDIFTSRCLLRREVPRESGEGDKKLQVNLLANDSPRVNVNTQDCL